MKKDKIKLSMYGENCIVWAKNGETRKHCCEISVFRICVLRESMALRPIFSMRDSCCYIYSKRWVVGKS